MALRGWRLFGVAGTIFAYVAGILLLSIISLNNSNPSRRQRSGRYAEPIDYRQRHLNAVSKRQSIQWCQPLRYLNSSDRNDLVANALHPHRNRHKPLAVPRVEESLGGGNDDTTMFDDRYVEPQPPPPPYHHQYHRQNNNELKINYEKLWPKNTPNQNKFKKAAEQYAAADERNLIALASFPGSGNTWLRYLLQQATGIFTGSVYNDFGLLKSGFPAERIINSSVLVVKTHEWGPTNWKHFDKAILLIRDPDQAIVAEFNRQSGGHVGYASLERYKRSNGRPWKQFVRIKLWQWEQMNTQWPMNFTGDVHIVFYDDMIDDVEGTLREILKFINFPIDENLLGCTMRKKEGIYRRRKRLMPFDPYTEDMHKALTEIKQKVYTKLGRYQTNNVIKY